MDGVLIVGVEGLFLNFLALRGAEDFLFRGYFSVEIIVPTNVKPNQEGNYEHFFHA